jgi:hypothetical protein
VRRVKIGWNRPQAAPVSIVIGKPKGLQGFPVDSSHFIWEGFDPAVQKIKNAA